MKVKKLIALGIAIMVGVTAILLSAPILSLEAAQGSDQKALDPGKSFFLYTFTDGAVYSFINGTPTLLLQTGVIQLTYGGSSLYENLTVNGPAYVGHPTNFSYTQLFKESTTLVSGSSFGQAFINNLARSSGSIDAVDGSFGVVSSPLNYPYHVSYSGDNQTVLHYSSAMGYTQPFVLDLNDFNESGPSVNYPYGNYYCYDYVGSTNVLVSMHLVAGTLGISTFLEQLLGFTNVNKPVIKVTNFNMQLIGTNTVLSPLDLGHYLGKYLFIVIVVWIGGLLYMATTIHMARKRTKPGKGAK